MPFLPPWATLRVENHGAPRPLLLIADVESPQWDTPTRGCYSPCIMATPTYLTLDKKGRATLPEEVREALGVGPGDFVLLERTAAGGYELVAAELLPRDQKWFYHPEMQERVSAAEAEIRTGAVRRESVANLLGRLKEPASLAPPPKAVRLRPRKLRLKATSKVRQKPR